MKNNPLDVTILNIIRDDNDLQKKFLKLHLIKSLKMRMTL